MIKYITNFLWNLICSKKSNSGVYILKLKDNKYYVGESKNIKERINSHINKKGSKWTIKYDVEKQIQSNLNYNKNLNELIETLNLMSLYGINNVRGSIFTTLNLSNSDKFYAAKLYCELNNLCLKCGKSGHFINNCYEKNEAEWIKMFDTKLNNRRCIECAIPIEDSPRYFKYCFTCYKKIEKK